MANDHAALGITLSGMVQEGAREGAGVDFPLRNIPL